jgi:hypothetical protein
MSREGKEKRGPSSRPITRPGGLPGPTPGARPAPQPGPRPGPIGELEAQARPGLEEEDPEGLDPEAERSHPIPGSRPGG